MTNPETVNIAPDYDRLRTWLLGAWMDPKQGALRSAILADPKTLAWLEQDGPLPDVEDPDGYLSDGSIPYAGNERYYEGGGCDPRELNQDDHGAPDSQNFGTD